MQVAALVQQGVTELTAAGVDAAVHDVHLLLGHCLQMRRSQLLAAAAEEVPAAARMRFLALIERRKMREPVAYILGEQEFFSRSFHVNPGVLIPRPETELLLETVIARQHRLSTVAGEVLDLCCGSGIIAIILALELGRKITAIDISEKALAVARENCQRHKVEQQVRLICSDLLSGLSRQKQVGLVLANPPYVSSRAIREDLEPEVRDYEPNLALDGGERGLEIIARIRMDLPAVMASGGQLFMEIGYDQGKAVADMFNAKNAGKQDFSGVEILKDYSGHDRVLVAQKT